MGEKEIKEIVEQLKKMNTKFDSLIRTLSDSRQIIENDKIRGIKK